eukprot:g22594.t1
MYVAVIRCGSPACNRLVPRSILEYPRLTNTCVDKKCGAKSNYIESKCNYSMTPMMLVTACLVAIAVVDSNLLPFIFNELRVPINTYPVQNKLSVISTATPNPTISTASSSSSQSPLSILDVAVLTSARRPVTACTLTSPPPLPITTYAPGPVNANTIATPFSPPPRPPATAVAAATSTPASLAAPSTATAGVAETKSFIGPMSRYHLICKQGYVVLRQRIRVPNTATCSLYKLYRSRHSAPIFLTADGGFGKKTRRQMNLKPCQQDNLISDILMQVVAAVSTVADNFIMRLEGTGKLIVSEPGDLIQTPHRDRSDSSVLSGTGLALSCIMHVSRSGKIRLFPYCLGHKKLSLLFPELVVTLNRGDIIIFRSDLAHSGTVTENTTIVSFSPFSHRIYAPPFDQIPCFVQVAILVKLVVYLLLA